mmetsp:Transcript_55305/g.152138  ORF Transcript_55305/g.152138 Transcript_55305/m.152138 type:complete len:208 (+) Transcript_55305:168-791(+)
MPTDRSATQQPLRPSVRAPDARALPRPNSICLWPVHVPRPLPLGALSLLVPAPAPELGMQLVDSLILFLQALELLTTLHSLQPGVVECIELRPKINVDQEVRHLDVRAQQTSEPKYAIAAPKPTHHDRCVRDLLLAIIHAQAEKGRVGLSSNAVNRLRVVSVQAAEIRRRQRGFSARVVGLQGQVSPNRTEASYGIQRGGNRRATRH